MHSLLLKSTVVLYFVKLLSGSKTIITFPLFEIFIIRLYFSLFDMYSEVIPAQNEQVPFMLSP